MTDRPEPEILDRDDPRGGDARTVRGPGWIGRNRDGLLELRRIAATAIMIAPPPARIPLMGACLAIDGALLAEEARTGAVAGRQIGGRAAGIALESATLLAATRYAPRLLAQNAGRIAAARRLFSRVEGARRD